jgi:hypothetical protein
MNTSEATITFANYSPIDHGLNAIYDIGATDEHSGVAEEMAAAFGYTLTDTPDVDNLGGLIALAGKAKELQTNIAEVQARLDTDNDIVGITRGWAERSGLLVPVERTYMTGDDVRPRDINLAVVSGGVRNWMERRVNRLVGLAETRRVIGTLLVAGNREMKPAEGPGVEAGMTEADYMTTIIASRVGELGLNPEVLRVDSGVGDEVMKAAARKAHERVDFNTQSRVAVVSNAGAWPQNVGQFRRAARTIEPTFDTWDSQIEAVSDTFPLGTGLEPTSTHQHPVTATAQIARNLQEYARHAA